MHRKGRGDTNAGVCNINKKGERCMLVLDNGKVITRDKACPFIEDGAVAIDGRTIVRVGTSQEIREAYPDAEHIDAGGGLIMPAFINVHEPLIWRLQTNRMRWDIISMWPRGSKIFTIV